MTTTQTTTYRAYHGKTLLKQEYIERMKGHMEADELIRGHFWLREEHRGCGIGCIAKVKVGRRQFHQQVAWELDVPTPICHLIDHCFEHSPLDYFKSFPLAFLEALPVGADCTLVVPKYIHWLLVDPIDGVFQYAEEEQDKQVIQQVAELYEWIIAGKTISAVKWATARLNTEEVYKSTLDRLGYALSTTYAAAAFECGNPGASKNDIRDMCFAAVNAVDNFKRQVQRLAVKKQAEKLLELVAQAPIVS